MMMTYGESPVGDEMQTECRMKILYITLAVGNYLLQETEVHPENYQRPQGFSVFHRTAQPPRIPLYSGAILYW
jgi:hypothetical protein